MARELSLDLLQRALDQVEQLVARVRPEQATLRTPCPDFDLRQLVNHIVFDVTTFDAGVRGAQRGSPDADRIDNDWLGAYRAAAAGLMAAWRERGIAGTLKTPIGEFPLTWALGQHIADLAVHAWDVAQASGQPTHALDNAVGETALEWLRENLKPQFRGQAFGPEVAVPATAPLYDQLAGFAGRPVP